MLTDNLQYLTDEERGWREETVKASSTRPALGFFRPRVDWRLVPTLDRLADTRARLANLGDNEQLQQQRAYIFELEQQVAYYKARVENEQHAADNLENCHLHVGQNLTRCQQCGLDITDNIHHPVLVGYRNCKQQLTDEEKRVLALSAELEVMREHIAELEKPPEAGTETDSAQNPLVDLSDRRLFPPRRTGGHF